MTGDEFLSNGLGLLEKGGAVMYVLLAFSVAGLAIVLLKVLQFQRLKLRRLGFVDDAIAKIAAGQIAEARTILSGRANPVARVIEAAVDTAAAASMDEKERDAEISRVGSAEIQNMETYLGGLEVIANLSPLLGLLGTVFGMIAAFSELQTAGSEVDPTILAGGIWEALLTTAFGLSIAIPALAAFYLLEAQVERVRNAMKDSVIRVNRALGRR
jgi:biopolymer transport protein ExbB